MAEQEKVWHGSHADSLAVFKLTSRKSLGKAHRDGM
jgi:hypothetical protein